MAHVKITGGIGTASVEVDGVDMSMAVLRKGFRIEFDAGDEVHLPEVHMIVAADRLEVDLPDAVIRAMQAAESEGDEPGEVDYSTQIRETNRVMRELRDSISALRSETQPSDIARAINAAALSSKRGRR